MSNRENDGAEHKTRTTRWDYVKSTFGSIPTALLRWSKRNMLGIFSFVVVFPLTAIAVTLIVMLDLPMWLAIPSAIIVIFAGVGISLGLIMAEISWQVDREMGKI